MPPVSPINHGNRFRGLDRAERGVVRAGVPSRSIRGVRAVFPAGASGAGVPSRSITEVRAGVPNRSSKEARAGVPSCSSIDVCCGGLGFCFRFCCFVFVLDVGCFCFCFCFCLSGCLGACVRCCGCTAIGSKVTTPNLMSKTLPPRPHIAHLAAAAAASCFDRARATASM